MPRAAEWPRDLRLERLGDVTSTQDLMRKRLAGGHDVHGVVLRASSQLRGLGRRQTAWSSAPGGSYQTIALRDASGSLQMGPVTLAVALGIARVFAESGSRMLIKWPNDLYLPSALDSTPGSTSPASSTLDGSTPTSSSSDGSTPASSPADSPPPVGLPQPSRQTGSLLPGKVGGILCEYVKGHLLVGVGLNVRNEVPPESGRLADLAPQLEPDEASELVLRGIEDGLLRVLVSDLPAEFAGFDLLAGRRIRVRDGRTVLEGVAGGVDDKGCLLVRNENGAASSCRARIIGID